MAKLVVLESTKYEILDYYLNFVFNLFEKMMRLN